MCGQEDHAEHHIDDPDDGIPHNSHPMLEEVDDTDGYRRPLGATMKLKLQLSTAGVASKHTSEHTLFMTEEVVHHTLCSV